VFFHRAILGSCPILLVDKMGCKQGKQTAPVSVAAARAQAGCEDAVKSPLLLGNEDPASARKPTSTEEGQFRSSTSPSMKTFPPQKGSLEINEAMETIAGATDPEPDAETTPRLLDATRELPEGVTEPPAAVPAAEIVKQEAPAAVPAAEIVKQEAQAWSAPRGVEVLGPVAPAPQVAKRTEQELRNETLLHTALHHPRAHNIPCDVPAAVTTGEDVRRAAEAAAARARGEKAEVRPMRKEKNTCCC